VKHLGASPRPHTLCLGNQKNKTHQGNKGEKRQSAYSSSQNRSSPPSAPVGRPSSRSRVRSCRDQFGAVPPVLGGRIDGVGNAKHPVLQFSGRGRGRCSIVRTLMIRGWNPRVEERTQKPEAKVDGAPAHSWKLCGCATDGRIDVESSHRMILFLVSS